MTTAICSTLILVLGSGNVLQNVRNFIGTRDFPKAETMYSVPSFFVCAIDHGLCLCYACRSQIWLHFLRKNSMSESSLHSEVGNACQALH